MSLADEIKLKAREIGFDLCGITDASPSRHRAYFEAWLAAGRAGEMHYLHERIDDRGDPTRILEGARSTICVALNYHTPLEPTPSGHARIARYALGDDYHTHLKDKLYALADWLRERVPGARTKAAVDTVPVFERELAERAGVGWIGKNTVVISPKIGSWILLGEVFTTIELPVDEPQTDHCGTCRRCIDACPTNAIVAPRELDATRCISYLTIEHRGEIEPSLAQQATGWLFGCDICQDVCPFNGRAIDATLPELRPRVPSGSIATEEVLAWDDERYWAATRRTAMRRVKLPQFQRNARLARGDALV